MSQMQSGYDQGAGRGPMPGGPEFGGPGYGYGGQPHYGYGYRMRPAWPVETKPFFLTSEFWGAVIACVGIAITAASSDSFGSWRAWILITAITVGYLVSRGIAKSGTKSRSWDPREDLMSRMRSVRSGTSTTATTRNGRRGRGRRHLPPPSHAPPRGPTGGPDTMAL